MLCRNCGKKNIGSEEYCFYCGEKLPPKESVSRVVSRLKPKAPLCMGCLSELPEAGAICRKCSFDNSKHQLAPYLPYGTLLNIRYSVARNLSTNGESTIYLGYDTKDGRSFFIREFLPIGLFDREENETRLMVDSSHRVDYTLALYDFINYFRLLRTLPDKSALVGIVDLFEANNTAYVIEKRDEIVTLKEYVARNGEPLDWNTVRPMFASIISLVENMHKLKIGHYAISPLSIFLTSDGGVKLGGLATENERKRGTMLKSQLFTGCAAPEQYQEGAVLNEATDVYGIAASLFYALTGNLPPGAKDRVTDSKLLVKRDTVKRIPDYVVAALADGLKYEQENRIDTLGELRRRLAL